MRKYIGAVVFSNTDYCRDFFAGLFNDIERIHLRIHSSGCTDLNLTGPIEKVLTYCGNTLIYAIGDDAGTGFFCGKWPSAD